MRAQISTALFISFLLLLGLAWLATPTLATAGTKVEICHIPPGNPANFHTITISDQAFSAHLAHGDLGGACDAACATLCDDGNACTIDDTGNCEQQGCPTTPEPVDCDDQNECTADSCAAIGGCVNTARLGESCDDEQVCSGPDTCNARGECGGAAIDGCCLGNEDCSQDLCDQASCNLATNRCGDAPVACNPPDLCSVSACASDTGLCVDSPVACLPGQVCNPDNGGCESAAVTCPCFDADALNALVSDCQDPNNETTPITCDVFSFGVDLVFGSSIQCGIAVPGKSGFAGYIADIFFVVGFSPGCGLIDSRDGDPSQQFNNLSPAEVEACLDLVIAKQDGGVCEVGP